MASALKGEASSASLRGPSTLSFREQTSVDSKARVLCPHLLALLMQKVVLLALLINLSEGNKSLLRLIIHFRLTRVQVGV